MSTLICQDCNIAFDSQANLKKHQTKFCINSKYANIELLQKQFNQVSNGRDISLYGKMSLAKKGITYDLQSFNQKPNHNIDKQYQQILDQINNRKDLKQKMQREKQQAYKQLQFLEKRQNDLIIDNKQQELEEIINRKKRLEEQEQQMLNQIQAFRIKKKQFQQSTVKNTNDEDFVYKQGRHAGKLAKQREMLQQKKKQLQRNLKSKKKQKEQIQHQLRLKQSQTHQLHYIPNIQSKIKYKGNQNKQAKKNMGNSHPVFKTPQDSLDSLSYDNNLNKTKSNVKVGQYNFNNNPINNSYNPVEYHNINYRPPEVSNPFNVPFQPKSNQLQLRMKKNKESNASSSKTQIDEDNPYLNPKTFSQNNKLLSEMVNNKGKSEQDLFIQQLNAQQYDALNLLAKLPKTSELYQLKLNQFKELSKLRDEYKVAAHKKRVQKMKRQFQFQKQIMQKEKNNALWVDENRKVMLAQQMNVIRAHDQFQKVKGNNAQQSQLFYNSNNASNNVYNPNGIRNNENNFQSQPYLHNGSSEQIHKKNVGSNQQLRNINIAPNQYNQNSKTSIQSNSFKPINNYNSSNNYNNQNNLNSNANLYDLYNQKNKYVSNQTPLENRNDLWGYKISVVNLKNYDSEKPIKIKLILRQHNHNFKYDNDNQQWTFSTTYHYDKAPRDDPYNPTMSNKADPAGNIIFNEQFVISQNLQNLYNKNQNQIYLFVIACQKDETKMTNEPVTYGWYSMKISHFAQIKQGKFTFSLYEDKLTYPEPSDMNKKKQKLKEQITIQLSEVILQKLRQPQPQLISQQFYKPPEIINANTNQTIKSKTPLSNASVSQTSLLKNQPRRSSLPMKQRESYKNNSKQLISPPNNFNEQIYFSNQLQTQFFQTNNKQQKNFDLIVTSLRTLPSYVGPVKLQISFIDKDNIIVIPKQQVLAQLGTDMYNPVINYIRKVRRQVSLTPSTIVFIRILAISAFDYDVYMLGFTIFYLFFQSNGSPCDDNNSKQYLMATGFYQIPVFWGSCEPHFTRIDKIVQNYPIIPCVSILVGIVPNTTDQSTPIPDYYSKLYNTILFNVQQLEYRLFQEQYKRQLLNTSKQIQGYLKYKGIGKKYSIQQAQKYIFKTMSFTKDVVQNLFPLDFMAEYNPVFGIYLILDKIKIINDKQLYYYFATTCLSPPAKFYHNKQNDLQFTYQVNQLKSKKNQIVFKNNNIFFHPQFDLNTSFIVQIKRGKINQQGQCEKRFQSYAHCIIPAFKQIQNIRSVNVKKQDAVSYQGQFKKKNIDKLQTSLEEYLQSQIDIPYSNIELSYRLVNGYFPAQFNAAQMDTGNSKSKYSSFFNKKKGFGNTMKDIKSIIQEQYSIQL